jgi:PAS domain S-box-containing protein
MPSRSFDELIDLTDDLLFLLDKEGNFRQVNKSGALNLDYEADDLLGKHFFSIVDENWYAATADQFSRLLSTDEHLSFETVLKSRLGSRVEYKIILRKIKEDGVGGIACSIASKKRNNAKIKELEYRLLEASRMISVERTRWKQDESILEELNKLKSEFISNISHELRTPLASIIGFSETILSDPDMSQEMRDEFNSIILTEGKRLARLINEILEISRMESGKVSLVKGDLNLTDLLKETVENNINLFRKKNLNFTFEFPPEDIIISGDKEKLSTVFDGLLNNAVKFTPENGRVKLLLHKMTKEAEIIISDTGIGIAEKDLPQIFQNIFTSANAKTYLSKSGLGLVFVKQIIDLHKGLILVHSELNKGTTFVIKLPYQNKSEGSL